MTHHSQTLAIPEDLLYLVELPRFILWLASYNLPPDAAYRVYKDWTEKVGTEINRQDLSDLCGADFDVN